MDTPNVVQTINTAAPTTCQYVLKDTDPCVHPVEKDGHCIFHLPKRTNQEKYELTEAARAEAVAIEAKFRIAFDNLLRQLEDDVAVSTCEFLLFEFPSISLTKRVFKKGIRFHYSHFKQDSDFRETVFEKAADFGTSRFHGEAKFTGVKFQDGADFAFVRFQRVSFSKAKIEGKVDFNGAKFEGNANFTEAKFGTRVDDQTSEATPQPASCRTDFRSASFAAEANFYLASFNNETTFEDASFEGAVYFAQTSFAGFASFKSANFKTKADFLRIEFNEDVNFTWASFGEDLLISGVIFRKTANFNGVTFALRTSILSTGEESFQKRCSFRWLRIPANALVTFDNLNLQLASFLDSDLTKIQFKDVKWYQPSFKWNRWHRRRIALWDEFNIVDDERRHLEKIAENYHQLVSNHESRRDYNSAEDFHIGEMETQRKKKGAGLSRGWRRRVREWLNPYGLYWLMSNYGSSYFQAFLMLVGVLLTFSIIFLYSGFQPNKESAGGSNELIEYNFRPDAQHQIVGFGEWIRDYARAILFSLSIITFQRERFYEPVGDWSRFWLFMAVLLLTTQAAMVLLAIRRRFKR